MNRKKLEDYEISLKEKDKARKKFVHNNGQSSIGDEEDQDNSD